VNEQNPTAAPAQAPSRFQGDHRFEVGQTVRVYEPGLGELTGIVQQILPDGYDGFMMYIDTEPHQDAFGATVSYAVARIDANHDPRFGYMVVELIAEAPQVTPETQPAEGSVIPSEAAAELLDTLPVGTIVRDADTATLWEREPNNWVCSVPWEAAYRSSADMARLGPFTVLHLPAAAPGPVPATPAAQAAAWAASCEALNAASPAARLAALQAAVESTVDDLERADLVTSDYRYEADTNIGEFRVTTGNRQLRAMMTGSLDTPAAHFLVITSDDDDPGIAMQRTTTDLKQVRAWIMSWTVAALVWGAAA
jgi:hypothetical protein